MSFTKVLTVALSVLLIFTTIHPALGVAQSQQGPTQQTVALLAQQAQLIRSGDARFSELLSQFTRRVGLSGPALINAFVASPQGSVVSLGNGISYYPLAFAQGLDMKQIASGQIQSALLGVMTVPQGATLAGQALPQKLGIAAMTGSLVVVLIDLSTGNVIAFLILPATLILAFLFFPVIFILQVVVQFIFVPIFPFVIFPIFLACPALPNTAPFSVSVGSGAVLATVNNGSGPIFQIQEGGFRGAQPALRITSFGPSLQFTLLSAGSLQIGFISGNATGQARLPLGLPFRLLVQGGGKTACVSAAVISFGFGLLISGTVAFN